MVAIYGVITLFFEGFKHIECQITHTQLVQCIMHITFLDVSKYKGKVFFYSSSKVPDSMKTGSRLLLPGRLKERTVIIDVIIHKAGSA